MSAIRIEVLIDASPEEIWSYVEQIDRHVEWMADAESIRFHEARRTGVGTGTRYECVTRFGPIRLTDQMEITRWEPHRAMGVRHSGIVTGDGQFEIEPVNAITTRFRWQEDLRFPWYMLGRVGGLIGRPVMTAVWRRNLRTLKRRVEDGR